MFCAGIFLGLIGVLPATAEVWEPTPLGGVVEPVLRAPEIRNELVTRRKEYRVVDIPLVLVREGRTEAAVVIPAGRSLEARESAELLVETIHHATGVLLQYLPRMRWSGLQIPVTGYAGFRMVRSFLLASGLGIVHRRRPRG